MAAVHVINPGKKRKRKPAKTAKAKEGAVATKKRKRRKATANPAPAAVSNPKKRKRRKHKSNPRRRRARRNPDSSGSGLRGMLKALNFGDLAREIGAGLGADLAMGFVVKRFGDPFGTPINGGSGQNSGYAGSAWSGKNYAWAAAASIGGGFALRMLGEKNPAMKAFGTQFAKEGVKSLFKRLFYTEVMGRSAWMQTTFGSAMRVMDDGNGNRWVQLPDGSTVAMAGLESAGHMGALVGADYYGELTEANYYGDVDDENIVDVQAIDEPGEDDDADLGTEDARSIDAGAFDVPGPGRRYFPLRENDVMANLYQRNSAFANR